MSAEVILGWFFLLFAIVGHLVLSFIDAGGMRILATKLVKFIDSHIEQKEDI